MMMMMMCRRDEAVLAIFWQTAWKDHCRSLYTVLATTTRLRLLHTGAVVAVPAADLIITPSLNSFFAHSLLSAHCRWVHIYSGYIVIGLRETPFPHLQFISDGISSPGHMGTLATIYKPTVQKINRWLISILCILWFNNGCFLVGDVALWLECLSMTGELSLPCAMTCSW